jgi:hypothetical protein
MKTLLQLKMPVLLWAIVIVLIYVAIKAPSEAIGLIATAGRIIGAIGDGVVKILATFHLKA